MAVDRLDNGIDRECPVCGKIYHVTDYFLQKGWKLFCSKDCQKKSTEVIYKCWNCGLDIIGVQSWERHFCSRKCQSLWRKKESENLRTRVCQWCGKEFVMRQPSGKAMKGDVQEGLFCSRKCRFADMRDKSDWLYYGNSRYKIGESCKVFFKECEVCGELFVARRADAKYCSDECIMLRHLKEKRNKYWNEREPRKPFNCAECGKLVTPEYGNRCLKKYCSIKCCNRHTGRNVKHLRRVRAKSNGGKRVYRMQIFKRDGYRCQICGKKVNMKAKVPSPLAPTIDHIVPLSEGGEHRPSNVQLAHFMCNSLKGNRKLIGGDQLRMFG